MNALKIVLLSGALLSAPLHAGQKITICSDNNFWYPFTFSKDNQAAGLHIDIIAAALKNLGFEATFTPVPWKRCLDDAKAGSVDAIATASYKDERAVFLNYPEGAATDATSPWRVTQVEYVAITPTTDSAGAPNAYVFAGDLKTLPNPVRAPIGYSIIDDLKKAGLMVDEAQTAEANFKKLMRDKTGALVDLIDVAKHFQALPEFSGKFTVQPKPITSKSYYFVFTKAGHISAEDSKKIWSEIARIRDDAKLFSEILSKYTSTVGKE
jgi:polar amino acid transport system substrate-binding protein